MGEEKKVFISYEDDSGNPRSTYVWLVSMSDNLVTFRTKNNVITIPTSRLLKLKEAI